MTGGRERRQHERIDVAAKVCFHDKNKKAECEVKNISKGGFFFLHGEVLEIGSVMDFEILHPSFDSPLNLKGRVIHVSSHQGDENVGCGIEIVEMPDGSEATWKAYEALLKS